MCIDVIGCIGTTSVCVVLTLVEIYTYACITALISGCAYVLLYFYLCDHVIWMIGLFDYWSVFVYKLKTFQLWKNRHLPLPLSVFL